MLFGVWRKKTCFIQFSLKNKALNFRGAFFGSPGITMNYKIIYYYYCSEGPESVTPKSPICRLGGRAKYKL